MYELRMYVASDKIFRVWRHGYQLIHRRGPELGLIIGVCQDRYHARYGGRKVKGQASLFLIDVPLKFVVNVPS